MNRIKLPIIFVLILIMGISYVIADTVIESLDVSYSSKFTSKKNVKEAIDELYLKAKKKDSVVVAEPILKDGLVPVTISSDGIVKKADINDEWYNYSKKQWANAVELFGEDDYNPEQTINLNAIRSFWVWIPKFKYKLWNVNSDGKSTGVIRQAHSIEIEFSTTNTTNENNVSCATPLLSGATGQCNNGEWMTHPAFISLGVDGFWVAKFEIGHKANTTTKAKTAMKPASDAPNIVIKPNYYSWTSTTTVDFMDTILKYNENLRSHMIKNTEWGAVAYLSHSKYGIDREVNINNDMDNETNIYIRTGRSANPISYQTDYQGVYGTTINSLWDTDIGHLASTTGNTTGVYDMSGGAAEYVAGLSVNISYPSEYMDLYTSATSTSDYKYRILGDAIGEMGPFEVRKNTSYPFNNWYDDFAGFVNQIGHVFLRGGIANYGLNGGQLSFTDDNGTSQKAIGTRIVLAPTRQ